MSLSRLRLIPLPLTVLLVASTTSGFAPNSGSPIDVLVRVASYEPVVDPATQAQLRQAHPDVAALEREAGGPWQVTFDQSNGALRRAIGKGIPWIPGAGNDLDGRPTPVELSELEAMARAFLAGHANLLGDADLDEWGLSTDGSQPLLNRTVWPLRFTRAVAGVAVEMSQIQLVLNNGNLVYVNATGLDSIAVSPNPKLTADDTWSALLARARAEGIDVSGASEARKSELWFVPQQDAPGARMTYRLIWRHWLVLPDALETWRADVDAHTGELFQFFDDNRYACSLDPTKLQGHVKGGVKPAQASDLEVVRHMILPAVIDDGTTETASPDGYYSYSGRLASCSLGGTYFNSRCEGCVPDPPFVSTSSDGILDFGVGGLNQTTNGFSTPADRTASFHLNAARLMAAKWIARPWFSTNVGVNVNIAATCNAFWDGSTVNFYRSGGGCGNTGEIRDVMQHEWGHGLDSNDGVPSVDRAMGEAYGDHIAIFIDRDSCIGQSFSTGSSGPYCDVFPTCGVTPPCTGVRNVDEKRTTQGLMTMTRAAAVCGGASCGATPLSRQCHCEGQVYGQTAFHLAYNLLTGLSYTNDAPIAGANPAMTNSQAWFVHERTFFNAGTIQSSYAPSHRQTFGTGAYDAYTLVDDDNGNPTDGTPHAAYINDAFTHHEVNELTLIPDSANCVPPADPSPTLTALYDPVSGNAQVQVDWNDTGAAFYEVYRNYKLPDVWLPVRSNVLGAPGVHTIYDEPVQVGQTYNYVVVAVGSTGCPSRGAVTRTITVALPAGKVVVGSLTDPPPGDGDGQADPGETVRIRIDLQEIAGLVDLVNAQVTLSTLDPFASVTVPGPIAYGNVTRGTTRVGPSAFEMVTSTGYPCGSKVGMIASVTADNACILLAFSIDVPAVGCVPIGGEAIPRGITVVTDAVNPSCTDNDGIPDEGETISVDVAFDNPGTLTVNNVVVTLSSTNPNLTVTSPNPVLLATLGGTSSGVANFELLVTGGSCQELAAISAVVDSDENKFAISYSTTVVLEEDRLPFFVSQGFETDFGPFTAVGFTRSTRRANSGTFSAYAGPGSPHVCDASADGANDCASMTSVPFIPGAGCLVQLSTLYSLEPRDTQYWDRANVHVINVATGAHNQITPFAGRTYNGGAGDSSNLCHVNVQNGWAGNQLTWDISFFDLAAYAGQEVRVEINYNSDDLAICEGLFVDDVTITDASVRACDALSCVPSGDNIEVVGCSAVDLCASTGGSDGTLDPGDDVTLTVTLRNTGTSDSLDVTGNVVVTGGTIISGATIGGAPRLDVAVGASYNHTVVVRVTGVCSELLDVDVINLGSSTAAFPPSLTTCDQTIGRDEPAQTIRFEELLNPALPIEVVAWPGSALTRVLDMNVPPPVTRATLRVQVTHARMSDLQAWLIGPLGGLLAVNPALTANLDVTTFVNAQGRGNYSLILNDVVVGELGWLSAWSIEVDTPGFTLCNPCDSSCTAPAVTVSASATSVCADSSVTFTPTFTTAGSGSFDYSWDFGDGSPLLVVTDRFAKVTHFYTAALPSYTVTFRAVSRSTTACDAVATTVVTIASGTVPTGSVGNLVRGTRASFAARFVWPGSGVTPPRFVVHKTFDKVELVDTPAGIGDEGVLGRPDIASIFDPSALLASPPLAFYEVHVRSSCGLTEFP